MDNKKEMTAQNTPVGAGAGQPDQKSTENSIPVGDEEIKEFFPDIEDLERRMRHVGDPHYLHTVSMTELYQTAYPCRPAIIDGLLYTGAYILAGASKIGKSFLVAQIAYHVSTGQKLWDYEVQQGAVLYLALEDHYQRIQKRMFMMYGVEDTTQLYFATAAKKAGQGLTEQMEGFLRDHPDTRLIVIDTLQKIRQISGEAYSYANDYEIIGTLKQFADQNNVCVLVVHHTRKQPADDSFEMISGTNGLLGCADGAFLMQKEKRTSPEATIEITGRDQQDQILYLLKDDKTQIWSLKQAETETYREPPDPVLEAISQMFSDGRAEWFGSPTELRELLRTEMAANTFTKYLNVKSGSLREKYGIRYENKAKHDGRRIRLTLDAPETAEK